MIDAGPSLDAAARLSVAAMTAYLRSVGWQARRSRGNDDTIRVKAVPEAEGPVLIPLPDRPDHDDEQKRVADALLTPEAVEERPLQVIADEVRRIAIAGLIEAPASV